MELINQINLLKNDLIVTTLKNSEEVKQLFKEYKTLKIEKEEDLNSSKFKLFEIQSKKDQLSYLVLDFSETTFDIDLFNKFNQDFKDGNYKRLLLVSHGQLNSNLNFLFKNSFVTLFIDEYSLENL